MTPVSLLHGMAGTQPAKGSSVGLVVGLSLKGLNDGLAVGSTVKSVSRVGRSDVCTVGDSVLGSNEGNSVGTALSSSTHGPQYPAPVLKAMIRKNIEKPY